MRGAALFASASILVAVGCAQENVKPGSFESCAVSLIVLGVAQDGGKPQIGNPDDPAWTDPTKRRLATSLALIDRRDEDLKRWLFEATPDIKEQLHRLNEAAPTAIPTKLSGVFLTHAHIGHYVGLMMFGHEALGAENMRVYAMPRMAEFLENNGPWSQLVRYENIFLAIMEDGAPEAIAEDISVTPFLVPHRQEFSEVVGFKIDGPNKSAIFLPDIDAWEDWDDDGVRIEDKINKVNVAFLDATFFADGEIPGRDMSGFPHPFVAHSLERFESLPPEEKSKVHFIHMNHTNPLHQVDGRERAQVKYAGFNVSAEGDQICL
ncbi:MAG: pyrroloquinoline quinone biosynthesis protein PqqB [Marinicaulis sp.]|nr:pyrroloquinoline quinone biosynthesis protein PqqB [Marinicaulis sp.]NNL89895.1 pyrroloquinoline quinone biosynthesis protein PqqB [Marinicaulis sp.]